MTAEKNLMTAIIVKNSGRDQFISFDVFPLRINITIDDLDHRHDGRIRSRAITTDTRPLQTIYGPSP